MKSHTHFPEPANHLQIPSQKKSYISVHAAVFLFGITGLFGKFLSLSPFVIVGGRVAFSAIFIGVWKAVKGESFQLTHPEDYVKLGIMGALLAAHWVTFFGAIQLSTVAIGLLTFSTFPVFVSLFKPFLKHERILAYEIWIGLAACIGIYLVVPSNAGDTTQLTGALTGVLSGAIYAVFTTYNEQLVRRYSARTVAFYEQVSAALLLLPFCLLLQPIITGRDWLLLIILGTIFTGIGHTLFISGLRGVTAYTAAMITMLEPLYAILLSALTLHEPISIRTAIGGAIILGAVSAISRLKPTALPK